MFTRKTLNRGNKSELKVGCKTIYPLCSTFRPKKKLLKSTALRVKWQRTQHLTFMKSIHCNFQNVFLICSCLLAKWFWKTLEKRVFLFGLHFLLLVHGKHLPIEIQECIIKPRIGFLNSNIFISNAISMSFVTGTI